MMLMYALEHRGYRFVLAFACGCALSSVYGFLAGTWPFGIVEAIWAVIALRRYDGLRRARNRLSPRVGKSAGERDEDRQIRVEPYPVKSAHPER